MLRKGLTILIASLLVISHAGSAGCCGGGPVLGGNLKGVGTLLEGGAGSSYVSGDSSGSSGNQVQQSDLPGVLLIQGTSSGVSGQSGSASGSGLANVGIQYAGSGSSYLSSSGLSGSGSSHDAGTSGNKQGQGAVGSSNLGWTTTTVSVHVGPAVPQGPPSPPGLSGLSGTAVVTGNIIKNGSYSSSSDSIGGSQGVNAYTDPLGSSTGDYTGNAGRIGVSYTQNIGTYSGLSGGNADSGGVSYFSGGVASIPSLQSLGASVKRQEVSQIVSGARSTAIGGNSIVGQEGSAFSQGSQSLSIGDGGRSGAVVIKGGESVAIGGSSATQNGGNALAIGGSATGISSKIVEASPKPKPCSVCSP